MSNETLADVQPGGRVRLEQELRDHRWDDVGERCLDCGDKDWMGGACSGPRAPEITAPWSPIGMAPNDGEPHIRGLWVTSRIDGAPATRKWRQFIGLVNEDGAFVDPDYGETFGWEADQFDAWMPLADAPGAALSAQPSTGETLPPEMRLGSPEYLDYLDTKPSPGGQEYAWNIAELVRVDLDRQSCPDAYMRIAMESVVKHLAARQPVGDPVAWMIERLRGKGYGRDKYVVMKGQASSDPDSHLFWADQQARDNHRVTPLYASPAQAVDVGQFRELAGEMDRFRTKWKTVSIAEFNHYADRLLALIDGKAVGK